MLQSPGSCLRRRQQEASSLEAGEYHPFIPGPAESGAPYNGFGAAPSGSHLMSGAGREDADRPQGLERVKLTQTYKPPSALDENRPDR